MQKFSDKLNIIAGDTNACLKKFFFKKNKKEWFFLKINVESLGIGGTSSLAFPISYA